MTRGGAIKISRDLRKSLDTPKGGSEKGVGLGGGGPSKMGILQNQLMISSYRSEWLSTQQFNELCAT